MEPQYQSDDIRIPTESKRLAAVIKGTGVYQVALDESLPPWGAKLEGRTLWLGEDAKYDNFHNCKGTEVNPELN